MSGIADYLKDKRDERASALQEYTDKQIEKIAIIIDETDRELLEKDFDYFLVGLRDYLLEANVIEQHEEE